MCMHIHSEHNQLYIKQGKMTQIYTYKIFVPKLISKSVTSCCVIASSAFSSSALFSLLRLYSEIGILRVNLF